MKKINKKGFTLIEVVLVIAIGALIFLLAFIAFGNAQTNRKDSQRRTALDTMAAEVENYKSDKNGSVPATGADLDSYVNTLKKPDQTTYTSTGTAAITSTSDVDTVYYQKATAALTSCAGVANGIAVGGWKIEMKLQKGIACRDSTSS